MELYKEKEINPFSSLGLVLIQLPLLIGLFIALRDIIKPGEIASLVYGPIRDLAQIKLVIATPSVFKPSLFGLVDLAKPSWILSPLCGCRAVYTNQAANAESSKRRP